jgi:hypothetical protein
MEKLQGFQQLKRKYCEGAGSWNKEGLDGGKTATTNQTKNHSGVV